MLFIILIQTLHMLHLKGTDGQEIFFDSLNLISPCGQGLRSGTDKYILTGTVGKNHSALVNSNWYTSVTIQISVSSSQFTQLCEVFIGFDGFLCDESSHLVCYCSHINSTTGSALFVVNYTALEEHSEGIIRAQWEHRNHSKVYSVNTKTLPAIYDAKAAQLSLDVSGMTGNLATPGSCNFSLTLNKSNHLILCCSNTATPCYPRISFRGDSVKSNACVSYPTSPLTSNGVIGDLVMSYSLCGQDDYIPEGDCAIIPEVYTTTSTVSTSTATSTITSASKAPVTTTPRTTTQLFLWTTDMRYDQADQKNLLTKFWPGLLISGLGFVLVLVFVVWDVVSSGTSEKKPTIENVTTLNEGGICEKNQESEEVHEETDSDTLKERGISRRMSETEV